MVTKMIELTEETQRQLAEIARKTGRAETDLLRDAITFFLQTHRVPTPKSDGVLEDTDLDARDIDDWLAATWRPE